MGPSSWLSQSHDGVCMPSFRSAGPRILLAIGIFLTFLAQHAHRKRCGHVETSNIPFATLKAGSHMTLAHDCSLLPFISVSSLMSPTISSVHNSTFCYPPKNQ